MATLEKIRSKSVLLIVIIGVALLAFIVGDALTNSRNLFGDGNTVAKIGGESIDYTEYQQKREELNNRLEQARKENPAQYANFDTQQLAQMAIDQLIDEKLVDAAVSKLGIRVTGDQLRYYMIDNPISDKMQELLQGLQQNGLNVQNPQQAYEIIFNPKRNGLTQADVEPYQRAWVAIENDTKTLIGRNIYQRILTSAYKANDLDKKALHNDMANTTQLMLAFTPYGNLDKKKYPVSDAEINAQYEKEKNRFKVKEPTKSISFIAVNVAPSVADRNASKKLANQVVAELKDSSSNQLSKNIKKQGVAMTHREVRANDLTGAVKNYVTTAAGNSVSVVTENIQGFTVVRMGKKTVSVDSIQLNIVQVAGSKLPAKVMAALNGGLSVDSINSRFSADSVMLQKDQWIPLFTAQGRTQALEESQLDSLVNASGKFITLIQQPQGAVIAQMVKQSSPKEIYSFDEITYQLKPSDKTVSDARTKLEKFIAKNNTASKFSANASKAGYTVQNFEVSQSTPALQGMGSFYPDSRQVIRWVMIDGETGEVSHIYESSDALNPQLYAVAIDAEYDDFAPVSSKNVREYVENKVRRSKAGDAMVKQYSAHSGSIEQVASAMKTQPQEVTDFHFGRAMNVRDAGVIGKIAGGKPGTKVYVVKGDDGVYAYVIKGNKVEKIPFNDKNYGQQYIRALNPNFSNMIRGNKKLVNKAYKFEAGD